MKSLIRKLLTWIGSLTLSVPFASRIGKVVDPDPPKRRQNLRRSGYIQVIDNMPPGSHGFVRVPDDIEPEHLRAAAVRRAISKWGAGQAVIEIDPSRIHINIKRKAL